MKLKSCKRGLILLLISATIVLCTACGNKEPKNNNTGNDNPTGNAITQATTIPSPIPSPTETPTPSPVPVYDKEVDLAGLYESKYQNNLYRIPLPEPYESDTIIGAQLVDGYLLALTSNWKYDANDDEEEVYSYVLFHLQHPDDAVVLKGDIRLSYELIEGGLVLEYSEFGDTVPFRIMDRTGTTIGQFTAPEKSRYIGHEETGLWFFDSTKKSLFCYSLTSGEMTEYPVPEEKYTWADGTTYLAQNGTKRYFMFCEAEEYRNVLCCLEPDKDAFYEVETTLNNYVYNQQVNLISRSSGRTELFESILEPGCFSALDMGRTHRYFLYGNGNEAVFEEDISDRNPKAEYNNYFQFQVVDAMTGWGSGLLNTKTMTDYNDIRMYSFNRGQGVLIAQKADDFHTYESDLYIWDSHDEFHANAADSFQLYEATQQAIQMESAYILDNFGVHIVYDAEEVVTFEEDWKFEPCRDSLEIVLFVRDVKSIMSEYPKGFFTDLLCDGDKEGLYLLVISNFVRISEYQTSEAAALTSSYGPNIVITFASKYLDVMEANFYHELSHAMEVRVEKMAEARDQDIMTYWENDLNSDLYPYNHSYVDEDGFDYADYSGTISHIGEEAYFIDTYSKTKPTEDRARIMEYLGIGNTDVFAGTPLKEKARFWTAAIREAFPSVKACEEPVFWEIPLGIVDYLIYIDQLPPIDWTPKG